MRRYFFFFFLLNIIFGCAINTIKPIQTIEDQTQNFHRIIEDTLNQRNIGKSFQSIAFGEMKVYKPESFKQLDSLYFIKKKYLDNSDLRGLKKSGIEDIIPGYRAAAQQDIDQLRYELECLYQTKLNDKIFIHHDYALFNHKDSLISISPVYSFYLFDNQMNLFYAYQFEQHFVDDRNLYISSGEQDFIRFFKQREMQLIGNEKLQPFMQHVFKIMEMAKKSYSVNFSEITKWLIINYFSEKLPETNQFLRIDDFGTLFMLEKDEEIVSYEQKITVTNENTQQQQEMTFLFSPYLELIEIK